MRSRLFVVNVLFAVALASCVNMGPDPYGEDIKAPTLTIMETTGSKESLEVTFGASLSGGITKEDCGFYLSLDETFATSEKVKATGIDKTGKFTYSRMLNNYDGKWYVKAYASNGRVEITTSVTSYTVNSFSTFVSATVPEIKSGSDGNIALTFSVFTAEGVSLSECGVCYGTDKSRLSIESDHISAGSSTGYYTATITGLKAGQEYYVCSYAREKDNVVYSSFVVISAPEIKTSSPSQITSSSAVCGGYDINSNGSEILSKGVVWSTSHNPVVETSYSKSAGPGSEPFSCTLFGLNPVTTYFVRAYAKNKAGIGYGEEITFTTLPIYVSGVELNKSSIIITEGDSYTLFASVKPSDATDKSVNWSSSNTSVATVDQSGKVTAVKAGSATITVTTTDGGYTATCSVTVKSPEPATPEMVDLGLSVKWASFNIGATKPEEYGGYYQWAGLEDVTSTSIYLDWNNCPYHTGSSYTTGWTKYIPSSESSYWSGSGSPDNRTILDSSDDVAQVKLGGKWRMPTSNEWNELNNNCTWTWTQLNGVNGYKVTSKKSGFTSKSIFFPAAGYRYNDSLKDVGSNNLYYWSSSVYTYAPYDAYVLFISFLEGYTSPYRYNRCYGQSVRPVYGDGVSVTGVSLDRISLSLEVGTTSTLSATVTPSNAPDKSVSWSSSNTGVATVDQSGKVTAVKAGSATITVTTTDGGYTATCSVTVKKRVEDEDGGNEDYDEEVIEW